MSKRTTYIIFLAKFTLSLFLIFWTIKMTLTAGVGTDDDNSFLSNYHEVDKNYNKIMSDNINFTNKYDTIIKINNALINEMSYKDIYLSQRAIHDRKNRKNILKLLNNTISISIVDKKTKKLIKNIDANIVFTRPSTHNGDVKIQLNNSKEIKNFKINKSAYWNIMGNVKIGKDEGNFFIKTNSK